MSKIQWPGYTQLTVNITPFCGGWMLSAFMISALILPGCEWGNSVPALTADDLLGVSSTAPTPKKSSSKTEDTRTAHADHLELKLKPGDRFPLLKTIDKEITQSSLSGLTQGSEHLELMMAVSVEEEKNDMLKMRVSYTRVKYARDLNGKKIEFDSTTGQNAPPEARPYQGMVGNSFSFWLGTDNQIVELIDFPIFLDRCLQDIPAYERDQAVSLLASSAGKDGIANFVDDTIGLLPYNKAGEHDQTMISAGTTWNRTRNINSDMPMTINQTYTVKELADGVVKVDVMGTITPLSTMGSSNNLQQDVSLQIRSGNSFGHCTIDLKTGLPIESHLDQFIDMQVSLAGGIQFDQRKRIVTQIRAFPQQDSVANTTSGEQPYKAAAGPALFEMR